MIFLVLIESAGFLRASHIYIFIYLCIYSFIYLFIYLFINLFII